MLEYILFVLGFVFLIQGARFLIDGSASIAKKLGISNLVIGLTVVAFGTSLPELLVNLMSAVKGTTEIGLGNIIGSNIVNILFILGLTAVIYPIRVPNSTVWREIPFSFLAALVLFITASDILIDKAKYSFVSRIDGLLMLAFFIIFIYYIFGLAKTSRADSNHQEIKVLRGETIFLMIVAGIVGLFLGGKWVVDGAVLIAQRFGLSNFFISATILAIGTSLPELVTSIVASFKKNPDFVIGNIVGSNIFNILWILGLTAVIAPIKINPLIAIDVLFLLFVTFLLFAFVFIGKKQEVTRWQGTLFVILYSTYIGWLILRG